MSLLINLGDDGGNVKRFGERWVRLELKLKS